MHNTASGLKNRWEQEALGNEQLTYDLLTSSTRSYQNALPYSYLQTMSYGNMVSPATSPYRALTSPHNLESGYYFNAEYDSNRFNYITRHDVDLTTIFDIISRINGPAEQLRSSLKDIGSYDYPTLITPTISVINPDLFPQK